MSSLRVRSLSFGSNFSKCLPLAAWAVVALLNSSAALAQTSSPPSADECAAKSYLECLSCCDEILQSELDKAAADYNNEQKRGRDCVLSAIQKRRDAEAQAQATKDACVSAAGQFQQTNRPHYEFLVGQCNSQYSASVSAAQTQFGQDHSQCVAIFAAANQAYNDAKAAAVLHHLMCQLGCKPPVPGGIPPASGAASDVSGQLE